ncbi:hypothetical protein D1007_17953 [Hordeum vulgare]|nr:hypothetical protein D1007_17953 [Hordeum vulgare]
MAANTEPNARLWPFELSDTLDQDSFPRMVVTLWSIWYATCKSVYEAIFQSSQQTKSFIDNFVAELGQATSDRRSPSAAPQTSKASWRPPPHETVKINVTGVASRLFHGVAVAAIYRDHTGLYLGSSVMVFHGADDHAIWET